jgi:hypothetical protein
VSEDHPHDVAEAAMNHLRIMAMGQADARWCLRRDSAFQVPAARLRCRYRGRVDVQLVQRAVGVAAGAV